MSSQKAAEFGKPYVLKHPYKTRDGHEVKEVTLQPPCYKHLKKAMGEITMADQTDVMLVSLSGMAPEELDDMRASDVKVLVALVESELELGK